MKGVIWVFNFSKHALSTRALSRSRRAAAADSGSSAACRRAAAAAFRARPGAAWNVPTVMSQYVTPEIVKNTDVQKCRVTIRLRYGLNFTLWRKISHSQFSTAVPS